jgi:hypothetical protein
MKLETMKSIDPRLRTLLLMVVGLSYPAWDVGFELGAYGQIFFEKIFTVWAISTALFTTFVATPNLRVVVPRLGWVALATPSFWLFFLLVFRSMPDHKAAGMAVFGLGIVSYVVCLPYVLYLGISVAYPELLNVRGARSKLLVVLLIGLLLAAGVGAGTKHRWFLTCEDFEVSGNFAPANCRPEGERPYAQ